MAQCLIVWGGSGEKSLLDYDQLRAIKSCNTCRQYRLRVSTAELLRNLPGTLPRISAPCSGHESVTFAMLEGESVTTIACQRIELVQIAGC